MKPRFVGSFIAVFIGIVPLAAGASPLRDGDRIAINVFNHPELTVASATIDGDGCVAVPLVGNVGIAGLEPDAAAARIRAAMRSYLREPSVSLAVLQQSALIAVVGGPVSSLPYVPGQTLASVAATLSSTPGLDLQHVSIARDGKTLGTYDMIALLGRAEPGPQLQPGDRIVFAQKPVAVTVSGIVKSPGPAFLAAGASIADAVYAAGGTLDGAAIGAIDLLRNGTHTRLALSSDAATETARTGDVITVPQALHISVGGRVAKPGDTVLLNGTTLYAALYAAGGPIQWGDVSHTEVIHDGVRTVYDVTRVTSGDRTQNPHLSEGDIVNVPTGKHVFIGDLFSGLSVASRVFFF